MDRARFDGIELEYDARGTGEPVMLVHAGIFADWFTPLLAEPALGSGYRLVTYHRVAVPAAAASAVPSASRSRPRIADR